MEWFGFAWLLICDDMWNMERECGGIGDCEPFGRESIVIMMTVESGMTGIRFDQRGIRGERRDLPILGV